MKTNKDEGEGKKTKRKTEWDDNEDAVNASVKW